MVAPSSGTAASIHSPFDPANVLVCLTRAGHQPHSRVVRRKYLGQVRLLVAIERAVSKEPLRISMLARGAYIPIAVKNYGFALLSVPPRHLPPVLPPLYHTSLECMQCHTSCRTVTPRLPHRTVGASSNLISRCFPLMVGTLSDRVISSYHLLSLRCLSGRSPSV